MYQYIIWSREPVKPSKYLLLIIIYSTANVPHKARRGAVAEIPFSKFEKI